MRYSEQLKLSAAWLNSVRNPDGGWGLNPGQASSIVNTAEALYVLNKAHRLPDDIERSVAFLSFAITDHPISRGPFLRYFAFGMLGFLAAGLGQTEPAFQKCIDSLRQAQIGSKGWSNSLNENLARVFPTFLCLWTLQMVEEQPSAETMNALNWLLTIQKNDGGWGYTDNQSESSNAACTAYALIVLRKIYTADPRLQRGKQWLIDHVSDWLDNPIIGESIGGTDWHHCNPLWASMALVDFGQPVLSPEIRRSVEYFQNLFDSQVGGWRQSPMHVVNVRSTFWAVLALEEIREWLDLNDITEAQWFALADSAGRPVTIAVKGLGFVMPKRIFALLILAISVASMIFYLVLSQSKLVLTVDQSAAKFLTTGVLIMATVVLLWKQKEVVRNFALFSIALLVGLLLSLWFIDNTLLLNFLSITGFALGLGTYLLAKDS